MAIFPLSKPPPARRPAVRPRPAAVLGLRLVWAACLLWGEWLELQSSVSSCHWPAVPASEADPEAARQSFRVLVIADPQLPSAAYSYPGRPYLLRLVSVQVINQFIRKAWRLVLHATKPDAIVVLGDLLDGGVAAVDPAEHEAYVRQFHNILPIPPSLSQSNSVIFLAGNHDLGLAPSTNPSDSRLARERFVAYWPPGKLSGHTEWANHTIVWIDAIGLIEENKLQATGESSKPVESFVRNLSGPETLLPKVLFTHVPLWRPEGTPCGPNRESSRVIRQGSGRNYQNEIPESASQLLLEKIQPTILFSGDDHDYCDVVHTLPSTSYANPPMSIHEISVKSFSMGMGVHRPGYQLLSLSNPFRYAKLPGEQTAFEAACVLPDQIRIYTHLYLPLLVLTLLIVIAPSFTRRRPPLRQQAKTNGLPIHHRHRKSFSRSLFQKSSEASDSSEEEGRSDEEAGGHRLVSQHSRGSGSVSLSMEPVVDGYGSPLSYHSPVDSGHEDDHISHPLPAGMHHISCRSAHLFDGAGSARRPSSKRPPLPTRHGTTGGGSRGVLASLFGRRRIARWSRTRPSNLARILSELSNVAIVILVTYGAIWLWFWW